MLAKRLVVAIGITLDKALNCLSKPWLILVVGGGVVFERKARQSLGLGSAVL